MCIIAIKPIGVVIPDIDTLENMWYNNPDGAGFMYVHGGQVHIQKGFMTLSSFLNALDGVERKHVTKEMPMVFHFRIGTHGGNTPENTHPFPISESVQALKKLTLHVPLAVVHNGIIDITPRKGISDTMECIMTHIALIQKMNRSFYKDKVGKQLVRNIIGSKMAFLDKDGRIELIGDFVNDKGMVYSNSSYFRMTYYAKYDDSFYVDGKYSVQKYLSKYDTKKTNTSTALGKGYTKKFEPTVEEVEYDEYRRLEEKYFEEQDMNVVASEARGTYLMLPLMWLNDDDGFVVGELGEPEMAGDYLIDEHGDVYKYDYLEDVAVRTAGNAYATAGTFMKFDETRASMMDAMV